MNGLSQEQLVHLDELSGATKRFNDAVLAGRAVGLHIAVTTQCPEPVTVFVSVLPVGPAPAELPPDTVKHAEPVTGQVQ